MKKAKMRKVENRISPYGVFWTQDGKRKSKYFDTEKAQSKYANKLNRILSSGRDRIISESEYSEWIEFKEATDGISLNRLLQCWYRYGKGLGGRELNPTIKVFMEEKWDEGISAGMKSQYRNHLQRFADQFGSMRMDLVTPEMLHGWLRELPYMPVTRKNHRKTVRTLYNWGRARGYCQTNPATLVKDERESRDIEILTVEECYELFEANIRFPMIGRLALEAFGLLRYSSAKRLVFSDINWTEKGITLPAAKIKTGRRTYVDGHSDNLWEWLEYAPKECWSMTERYYQEEKRLAFGRAGIRHPYNVLRHSACTYHYAAYKDPGLTAALMAHTNLRTMEQFYRGRSTQADGLRWFDIRPSDFS